MSAAPSQPLSESAAWQAYDQWRLTGGNRRLAFSFKQRVLIALASAAFRVFSRFVSDSLHWEIDDPHDVDRRLRRQESNYIFAVWHNRLIGAVSYFERYHTRVQRDQRLGPLVSESFDGELIARAIRDCQGENVRGSSSHNAVAGLRQAVDALKGGLSLFVTGDGPKGPRYQLKPGCIMAAKLSGRPIVPVIWSSSRALQFRKSWDQLLIPLRGARMHLTLGAPLFVDEGASAREIATARRELEAVMQTMAREADSRTRIARLIPPPRANEKTKLRKVQQVAAERRM